MVTPISNQSNPYEMAQRGVPTTAIKVNTMNKITLVRIKGGFFKITPESKKQKCRS